MKSKEVLQGVEMTKIDLINYYGLYILQVCVPYVLAFSQLFLSYPVRTQRHFNVHTMSSQRHGG